MQEKKIKRSFSWALFLFEDPVFENTKKTFPSNGIKLRDHECRFKFLGHDQGRRICKKQFFEGSKRSK
jgi:hypothetical protein